MMGNVVWGRDQYVIHVYHYFSGFDERSEDRVHHRLECAWGVCESKEHDAWFIEPQVHFKGPFPLISILDSNVVVSPMDVELGE